MIELCSDGNFLKTMKIILTIINVLRIMVPLGILFMASFDFYNAVKEGSPEELKKRAIVFGKRIIIGLMVFFAPTLINITVNAVSNGDTGYAACINNATNEGIQNAFVREIEEKIKDYDENGDEKVYDDAKHTINKEITDKSKQDELNDKIDQIHKKRALKKNIDKLKDNYSDELYEQYLNEVNELDDSEEKEELLKILEEVYEESKKDKPLELTPGAIGARFNSPTVNDYLDYYVYIPNNGGTANMPLVIYLHGDASVGSYGSLKTGEAYPCLERAYNGEQPFIMLQPNTRVRSWTNSTIVTTLKELIEYVIKEYQINPEKVILSGGSRGGMGAWNFANKYPQIFSAFVPISGTGNITASNFKNLPTWAFSSKSSSDSWNYSNMESNVNAINNAGGNAKFSGLTGYNHSTILSGALTKETFEWMIAQ